MTEIICVVCGQSADQLGSYDAQGNPQRCSDVRVREIGLIDLADLMREYYKALIQRNVPDVLAQKAAGDWHKIALEAGRWDIIARMTRKVARSNRRDD